MVGMPANPFSSSSSSSAPNSTAVTGTSGAAVSSSGLISWRASRAASAIFDVISLTARIASSFPGMTWSISSIAVGIGDGDDRDGELAGLGDGDVFLTRVDDINRARQALHLGHAAEEALQPLVLLLQLGNRFLAAGECAIVAH